jgi:hypothetical protein
VGNTLLFSLLKALAFVAAVLFFFFPLIERTINCTHEEMLFTKGEQRMRKKSTNEEKRRRFQQREGTAGLFSEREDARTSRDHIEKQCRCLGYRSSHTTAEQQVQIEKRKGRKSKR